MKLLLQMVGLAVISKLIGLTLGYFIWGQAQTPPALQPSTAAPLAPAVAAAVATPPAPTLAAAMPAAEPTAKPEAPAAPPAVPAQVDVPAAGVDPIEIALVPRGPGRFAVIDLESAGVASLAVRQGTLTRDGAAAWATFANRSKLTLLKAPTVRVEWLHLGFDPEARPVVAHIRTTGHAGGEVEGVISLKNGDQFIAVHAEAPPQVLPTSTP